MAVEKIWKLREGADADNVRQLSSELGVDPVLAELLVQRGVRTFEQARSFFRPSLDDLHDPFLMTDMDKAVERVHKAVSNGEKILVYGDYDVDGTTAVSLVYSFLRRLTRQLDFYVPERYDEGYGVSYKGSHKKKEQRTGSHRRTDKRPIYAARKIQRSERTQQQRQHHHQQSNECSPKSATGTHRCISAMNAHQQLRQPATAKQARRCQQQDNSPPRQRSYAIY